MWVDFGEFSLATMLLESGYDVWLGNNRGNIYSRYHLKYDADDDPEKYFDFSFYEMGKYDQPAMISGILKMTKTKSLTYVGHSQGTT